MLHEQFEAERVAVDVVGGCSYFACPQVSSWRGGWVKCVFAAKRHDDGFEFSIFLGCQEGRGDVVHIAFKEVSVMAV